MSVADGAQPEPGPDAGKDDIEADIDQMRTALGETTSALAAKLDVPQQVRQKVTETKQRFSGKAVPIAVALSVAVIGVLIWRRRRR